MAAVREDMFRIDDDITYLDEHNISEEDLNQPHLYQRLRSYGMLDSSKCFDGTPRQVEEIGKIPRTVVDSETFYKNQKQNNKNTNNTKKQRKNNDGFSFDKLMN